MIRSVALSSLLLTGCFFAPDAPQPSGAKAATPAGVPTSSKPAEPEEPPFPKPAQVDEHRLSVGLERVCLVKGDRGYCVGTNNNLELGDGTTESRGAGTEPGQGKLKDVWQIAATENGHSCALAGGKAWCYGKYGVSETPAIRPEVKKATWMSGGYASYCFVHDGGKVQCLGPGLYKDKTFAVTGITDAARISCDAGVSGEQCCAVLTSGKVACFGGDNQSGSLGRGFAGPPPSGPTLKEAGEVVGLTDVVDVAGGDDAWCAVTKNNELWCWGNNNFDRFGVSDDKSKQFLQPTKIAIPEVTDVAVGSTSICAIQKKGTISCFGFGSSSYFPAGKGYPKAGKLWPGAKLDTPTEIATSGRLLCVLAAGDKVTCYGDGAKLGVADGAPKEFAF
jgi:hypothetical protein